MFEIGNVPMRSASAVISSLSMPTSGRSTVMLVAARDRGQVLERLRRDLSDDFARDQRLALPAPREPLGDPQHQPAVDDDAELGRDGQQDLLLQLAERHEHSRERS